MRIYENAFCEGEHEATVAKMCVSQISAWKSKKSKMPNANCKQNKEPQTAPSTSTTPPATITMTLLLRPALFIIITAALSAAVESSPPPQREEQYKILPSPDLLN
eukprot:scaffold15465_cov89-Skeletonema_dohrnii-CCMP3373.AAC.1